MPASTTPERNVKISFTALSALRAVYARFWPHTTLNKIVSTLDFFWHATRATSSRRARRERLFRAHASRGVSLETRFRILRASVRDGP